jgi:hypothetical protein
MAHTDRLARPALPVGDAAEGDEGRTGPPGAEAREIPRHPPFQVSANVNMPAAINGSYIDLTTGHLPQESHGSGGEEMNWILRRQFGAGAVLVLIALHLAGCGGPQVTQNAPRGSPIRSIVLIEVPDHQAYSLTNNSATMIGVYAGMAKQGGFSKFLRDGGFNFGREMTQALKDELEGSGYQVVIAEAERKDAYSMVGDYRMVSAGNSDAILDVAAGVGVGYTTGTALDPDYRPCFTRLQVQLVSSRSKDVLYGEKIKYGSPNIFVGGTAVPAPKQYYYADFEKLTSGSNAIDGLRAAVRDAARYIVGRIRNGGAG